MKPQATLAYAAEPRHPRDRNLGHSLVLPYNMIKEENNQWPKCKEREVWMLKSLRNRTMVFLYVKDI